MVHIHRYSGAEHLYPTCFSLFKWFKVNQMLGEDIYSMYEEFSFWYQTDYQIFLVQNLFSHFRDSLGIHDSMDH